VGPAYGSLPPYPLPTHPPTYLPIPDKSRCKGLFPSTRVPQPHRARSSLENLPPRPRRDPQAHSARSSYLALAIGDKSKPPPPPPLLLSLHFEGSAPMEMPLIDSQSLSSAHLILSLYNGIPLLAFVPRLPLTFKNARMVCVQLRERAVNLGLAKSRV
jgi:hypothetical protein